MPTNSPKWLRYNEKVRSSSSPVLKGLSAVVMTPPGFFANFARHSSTAPRQTAVKTRPWRLRRWCPWVDLGSLTLVINDHQRLAAIGIVHGLLVRGVTSVGHTHPDRKVRLHFVHARL